MGVSAQYVKMSFAGGVGDINHGDTSWWGLNEVRLISPVPEPATLSLFTCGLIGFFTYARRKQG
jgi:hypothetical protein